MFRRDNATNADAHAVFTGTPDSQRVWIGSRKVKCTCLTAENGNETRESDLSDDLRDHISRYSAGDDQSQEGNAEDSRTSHAEIDKRQTTNLESSHNLKIVAVTISKDPLQWKVPEIPFVNYTEGYKDYPHYPRQKSQYRIEYLAERRNAANREALRQHPDLTHFLSLDSYYLDDVEEIRALVAEYEKAGKDVILGASTWYKDPSRIRIKYWFWDTWTNPEFLGWEPTYRNTGEKFSFNRHGWVKTKGAGGFTIVPRWAWEKQGYAIPYPFPESGCESNYLSRCPGIDTYITFNVKAWRDPPEELKNKPYRNRVRTSLGIGTRLRKIGVPDIYWILKNRVFLPQRRIDWIKGSVKKDGFSWTVRGCDDSFLAYNGHEPNLDKEILQPGRLFVDIGSHVGRWTVRASKYYDKVVAFEPSQKTRSVLLKNVLRNHVKNVEIQAIALGDDEYDAVIYHHSHMSGGNSLQQNHPLLRQGGVVANKTHVMTLDHFHYFPTLIKIDTEGNELPVLNGALETLKRTKRVIVESHRDDDVLKIKRLLLDSGFNVRLSFYRSEVHVIGERN